MLLEKHLRSRRSSNNSEFFWEEFYFDMCEDFKVHRHLWAAFVTLSFAVGFPASIAVLWEMIKTYKRGAPFTPNYVFMLNLSIMDGVFLVFIPPGLLNNLIWKNWSFEALWNCVYALSTCGRPLMMACICLDCYLAVVHPVTYHKRKSLTPRVVMAGIVWALTVATGVAYFLFNSLFSTMFPTVPLIIAMVIIGLCDSFILHTLIKSDPGRKNIHPQKQRAIQTLVNSLVMSVLSYLPPVLLYIVVKPLVSISVFICAFAIPLSICYNLGSCVMPLLHLKNHGKLDLLRVRCCSKS